MEGPDGSKIWWTSSSPASSTSSASSIRSGSDGTGRRNSCLWLCRHIEEFVELRVEPLEVNVREATGTDAADDRDAMDEGHVVRLPEESNHVRERSLRDDLIESVVEDYAALPFAGHRQDRAERGIEVPRMDRAGDPAGDLDDRRLLDAELQAHAFGGRGRHDEPRLPTFDEVPHPGDREGRVPRHEQVALPGLQMAQAPAAVRAGCRPRVRPFEDGLQLPAGLAPEGDLPSLLRDPGRDRLLAVRATNEAGRAGDVVQGLAGAPVRPVVLMDRLAALDALADDGGGRLRRRRHDDLLDDRTFFADDRSERPPQAAIVGRARAVPKADGHGDGEEPERQAGDDRAEADEPQGRRD